MKKISIIISFIMIYSSAFLYAEGKAFSKTVSENQSAKDRLIGHWNLYSKHGRTAGESLQLIFRNDGTGTVIEAKGNKEEKENISWTVRENSEKEITLSIESKDSSKKEEGLIKFEGECLIIDDSCFKKVNAVSDAEKQKRRAELMDKMVGEWHQESENGRPVKESVKFVFRKDGTGSAVMKPPEVVKKEDFNWTVTRKGSNEWSLSSVKKESGKRENASLRFEGSCLMLGTRCLKKIHSDSSSESEDENADINDKIVGDWYLESENGLFAEMSLQYSFKKDGSGSVVLKAPENEEKKEFKWNVSEQPDGKWAFQVLEKGMTKERAIPLRFDGDCLMLDKSCLKKINSLSESENKKAEIINKMIGDWYMETDNGRPLKEKPQFTLRKNGTGTGVLKSRGKEEKKEYNWTVIEQADGGWRFSIIEKESGRNHGGMISFEGDCLMIDKSCLKRIKIDSASDAEKRKADIIDKIIGDWYMATDNGRPVKESVQFSFKKDGSGAAVLKTRDKEEKKEFSWKVSEQSDGKWTFSVLEKGKKREEGAPFLFDGDCLMVDKSCLKKIEPSSNNDAENKKNELINKIVGTWAFSENGKLIPDSLQFSFRKDGTGTAVGDIDGKTEQKEFNWTVSEKEPDQWVMSVAEQGKENKEEGPIRFEGECLIVENTCLKKIDSASAAETEKMKEEISQKIIGDWDLETENGKAVPYGEKAIVYFYRDGKGKTVTETADRRTKTEEFLWKIFLKDKDQWMISFKEQSSRRNRTETKEIIFKNDRLHIGALGLKKRETSNLNPIIPVKTLDGILSRLKHKWNRQSE